MLLKNTASYSEVKKCHLQPCAPEEERQMCCLWQISTRLCTLTKVFLVLQGPGSDRRTATAPAGQAHCFPDPGSHRSGEDPHKDPKEDGQVRGEHGPETADFQGRAAGYASDSGSTGMWSRSWRKWSWPKYGAVQWSSFARVNAFCNLMRKKSGVVAASLPGRFLSRHCFTLCITMEVEPRIVKQYKCLHCCSCKNYQVKRVEGWKKCLCVIFWLTRRL